MSWKLELLIYSIFFIGTCLSLLQARKQFLKKAYVTKDGYYVTPKVLRELFPKYKNNLDSSLYGLFDGFMLILMSVPVVIGYLLVAGVGILFSIGWFKTTFLGLVVLLCIVFIHFSRKEIKSETERLSSSIYFEIKNPSTGIVQYLSNPSKYFEVEQRLIKSEESLKNVTNELELREIEYQHAIAKGNSNLEWYKNRISYSKHHIENYSNEVILLNKRLQQLLSDDIPRLTADIINQKEQQVKPNHVPHHIKVLQRIASDTSLPDSMREDARVTLETQIKKEANHEEESRLQDAQIELEIAKKLM